LVCPRGPSLLPCPRRSGSATAQPAAANRRARAR
jgi:hypothetical protein